MSRHIHCSAIRDGQTYNRSLISSERFPPSTPLILPKLGFVMSVLGLENWGVLVTLNASNLNSNPMPSRIEKRRKAAASKLKKPGPEKAYRAILPWIPLALAGQFTATPFANVVTAAPTGQTAEVSNQKSLSIPPST